MSVAPIDSIPAEIGLATRVALLGTEEAFSFGARIRQVEAEGERVIRCNLGQPDFPLPRHIVAEVVRALEAGMTTYCDPQGLPELRATIAREVGGSRGMDVDPERVVVYPGGRPPIGFAQQAYCNAGDEVVFPTPGYPLFESFVPYVGAVPVPLSLKESRGFSITGEDLAAVLSERTKLVFLNFPSNPTGGVASRADLEDISRAFLKHAPPSARLYSDESYEAIVFDGEEHISLASLPGMESRTIVASGVSKTYSWTGGRVGWAIYPTVAEAKVHRNLNINYFASLPPYNQMGAKLALESDESAPAIREMVEAFQRRRDLVVTGLNEIEGVHCQSPKGAFYAFPNVAGVLEELGALEAFRALDPEVRRRSSPATLFQLFLLHRYRVATMDRRSFGIQGSDGQHFLRLSIATGDQELTAAVDRIARASRDREGFRSFLASGVRLTP
ncbi:MAG: aminotransferase class I/II-fold pyridoxal phosphate-dependent enzyme [Gemmatimonadota bacterium]|nr:aminotransferase class I/II-fold pyridoxal phosphate-dependent enzyme [Gemmatimonadota bacterium]